MSLGNKSIQKFFLVEKKKQEFRRSMAREAISGNYFLSIFLEMKNRNGMIRGLVKKYEPVLNDLKIAFK